MLIMTNCEIKARKVIEKDIKNKAESNKDWKAYVTIANGVVKVSFFHRENKPVVNLEKSPAYKDAKEFKKLLQETYPSSVYKENATIVNFKNGVEVVYNIPYKLIKDQEAKNNEVTIEKYEEEQQKEVHKIVYQDSKDYINDEGDVGFEITTTYPDGTIQISKLTRIQDIDELLKKEYKKQQQQYQYSEDLTPEAQERIIDQLTGMLMDTVSYDLLNKKQPNIFYKESINKDGKKLEFNFLSIRKSLLERAKELFPKYQNNILTPEEFDEFKNLTTVLNINVFPKIQNDIVNRLKARGYKFKSGNKLEELQDDGNLQELYDQLSSIDNTDFELAEDITGKSDQLSDYSALTTSNKEKMSSKLRTFLSSIENGQQALITLKIGDKVYNKQYVNENIVIQAINEVTVGVNTYEEVLKALQDASVAVRGREFLAQVVEKLQLEKAKGSEIVNQFVDKFNQQKNDLTLTVFEKKPVVLSKFKKDGKWIIVPLRDNNGNTMFYYDYKVINANRNDILTNLKNDAKQRFIEANELTEETVDKEIVADTVEQYKNFRDFVKSDYKDGKFTNPEEAINKLKSLFETLNFEFSDELYKEFIKKDSYKFNNINFNLDGKGKSVFNKSYGILNNIFGNLEEDTSIDKLFGNSGARKLFEVEAETKEYFYNTSTLDGKGRNIWGYSMPSPMFRELNDIINDDNLSFIASDPTQSLYTSSSYILSELNRQGAATEDILQFKANLKYSLFNTLKQKGEEGKELDQMEPAEFIATQIILHIGNDIVTGKNTYWSNKFLTTPSDKSTMYLVQTPNMSIPVDSNGKPTISLNSDLVDRFYNYFLGEYRRAKDYQDANEAKKAKIDGITTYEPLLFYNFPQLNLKNDDNILWKKQGDSWVLRDLSESVGSIDVETYVKTELLQQLKAEVENIKEKLNTVGLVQNNTFINGFPDSYKKRVPNSVSLQSEIKSLNFGDLGKDEFKKQMLDLVNQSNANLTEYMIHDYALNYLFHNIEMHTLILGDPAQYLKDEKSKFLNKPNIFNSNNINEIANYIDAIRDNLSKRMAGAQANRMEGNTSNESTNIVTLVDVPTDSKIIEEINRFNPDQASKYEGIKSMDGQEIMTAEEDLKQKLIHGKISQEKYQMLYDKLQRQHEDMEKEGFVTKANEFTKEDGLNAQPIKPVVFGNVYDPELKIFKTTYYKDSAFGLYPQFTQGLELDKIRRALYNLSKQGIVVDRLVMKSAAKLGAINPVQDVFNEDLTINQDKLEGITKENIDTVPRSKQGIQLEVPYDPYKKEIRIASQQVKLIFNEILNVNWDGQKELIAKFLPELKNEKVTGKLLKNYHNNVYRQIVELSLKSILDEIGITVDINKGTYKFENLEKLSKTLQNTAIQLGYSKLALDGLTITADGKQFVLPISFNENGDRLEKLLLSILNKAILQKISGRSFVLASEMGFVLDKTWIKELKEKKPESEEITENVIEGEEAKKIIKQYQSSIVFTEGFDPEMGLLPARRKDPNNPNSEILPAQVLISWKFLNNKNEQIDINEFITEKDGRKFLDTSKIDPEILRILGIRIPVQGHPSMASIEIVGFLPEFMGDIIIAPQDFVAMMGSDFDIDKLYGYMYNYQYKKGKLSKLKFDESKIEEIDEEEFLLDSEEDFTEAINKLEKVKQKKEEYKKEQKKKMLQNKLIDIYHTIMLHPTVYDKSLQGITEGNLGELSKTLKGLQQKKNNNYYSPSSVTNKIDEYFENKAGKLGVGVFSVNSTFLTVVEGLGLELQKIIVEKDENGKDFTTEVPDYFTIPISADTKDNPEKFYVISGNIGVNKLISMFQSASVDNAKLKYLNWISVNKDTMGVAAILSSLANDAILGEDGNPLLNEDYIVYFLSQPIIKEYIDKVNAQNVFSGYVDTKALVNELLEKYKEEASKAIDSNPDLSQPEKIAFKNKFSQDPSYTLTELQQFVESSELYNTSKEFNYLIAQYQVLTKFLKLKDQADVLRRLQYLVNADAKGLPSTLAEANYKSKRTSEFVNSGSPIIKNVSKVFVNESGKEVNEKEITTEFTPFSETLLTLQGYLENISDSVSVKIFSQNNNIIASGTRHVEHLSKIITLFSGKKTENYPHNLVNNITKSYIAFTQSTNNLQIQSPDKTFKQEIVDLLQDREGNTSLATDLENFKKTKQYKESILLKPFLESLKTEIFEGYKFVKYQASQGLLNTDEQIVQALIQLQDLNGVNGTYPLFEKLIKYTFLVKLQKSPITIRQFVPVYMQEALGLLRQFREKNDFFNIAKYVTDTGEVLELPLTVIGYESDIPVYSYIEQFFQHNPEELKSVSTDDYKFLDKANKPTDDVTDTILIKGEIRSKYTAVYEGKEFDLPYVSIYSFDERRFNIFKKLPNSDGIYTKIPNLGRYNLDEYNADTKTTAVSILPSNQVKNLSVVTAKETIPTSPKDFIDHSGGARGADEVFDREGRKRGVVDFRHYYTGTVSEENAPLGNIDITDDPISKEGARKVAQAAKVMWGYKYDSMKDSRLIRNWAQVANSDAVFAIAPIGKQGDVWSEDKDKKEPRTILKSEAVQGGTGYAVEMAIQAGKPVYVYNDTNKKAGSHLPKGWYTWDGTSFVAISTPILTKNFAGIGSRNISKEAEQAIANLYDNTFADLSKVTPTTPTVSEGIEINSKQTGLGNDLTNVHYATNGKSKFDIKPSDASLTLTPEAKKTWGESVEAWYKSNNAKSKGIPEGTEGDAYDMKLMIGLITDKLKQYPNLVTQITERGGLAFLDKSTHTMGTGRWSSKNPKNMFMNALKQAYRNVSTTPTVTTEVKVISEPYGVVVAETNPTKDKTQEFVNLIQPQIQAQAYKENVGTYANDMFMFGLRWTRKSKAKKPLNNRSYANNGLPTTDAKAKDGYVYDTVDQNGNSLPDLSVLQPIIDEIEQALGRDMSDYDAVIGNIYLPGQNISTHKDTTESLSARNYPVIVYTIGNNSAITIYENQKQPGAASFASDKKTTIPTKDGTIYTFGLDGKGRFEVAHDTPKGIKRDKPFPPITLPNGDVITNYTITLTFRRAADLEAGMPDSPAKITKPATEVKPEIVNSQPNKVLTPVADNQKGQANNVLAQYGVEDTQTDQEKIKTILNKISVDSNAGYFKELANLLKQLDAQFNFTEKLKVNFVENSDSFFNPNDNSINLNVSNTDAQGKPIPAFSERVQFEILHELIHAVLDERLGIDQAGTIVLNRIKRLTKSLESAENLQKAIELFDLKDDQGNKATVEYLLDKLAKLRVTTQDVDAVKYNSEAERSVLNPLINEREFIASVLGDNQTRMWMNEVQYDETSSILSKILDTFKSFLNNLIRSFGFKIKDKSALQEAINIVFDTVNYEVKDTTETVEFLDFGTYYKFEVKNGVVVKGEFSQGNKTNYNPLTKPSKKYTELLQSSTAERLTTEEIKLVEQVKNVATVSGKTLQGEQVQAFEKATTWLNKPANTERDENGLLTENAILDNMFFLSGPGGSGKTFITEIIVSDLSKKGKVKLVAAAPTHQAKNVLKENLPKDTDATTVQSLLGMLPNPINKSTFIGNTLEAIENAYYEGKPPSIFDYDYLVIDEASMIDSSQKLVRKEYKKVWSDIKNTYVDQTFYENPDLGTYLKEVLKLKERLTGKATKVFLMGDIVQVVPVGSGRFQISKLLTDILKRNENNALLNQIRRTNNEEVKRLSLLFRESFNTLFENNNARANFIPNINSVNANNNITLLNQKKDVVETFIRLYKENIASGNPIPNFTNIIWYNNSVNDKTVNQTKVIRQILFNNQEEINPNESLILKSNYPIKDFFGQGEDLILGNDTKFIVTKVEDGVKDFTVGKGRKVRKISNIPVKNLIANVQVGSVILENVPISIVTPSYFKELGDKFEETNPSVEGQSMTKGELYNLIENVTSVEYGYIVNSHKIQGSKVLNPIVDVENILASPEDALHVNNMIYTAISRTVNSLYIFHPQLTPKEGKPISKLTGVSNPQVPQFKDSTEAKDLTLDYLSQRLNVQYAKRSNIYSDKTLTEQERKIKLLPVETTIARLQANLESLKNNFVLSEYFRLAQKELNDFKDLLNNSSSITEEDYFQAIQIFGYFDKLYSALNTQVTNYNDPNQMGDKFIVPAELWDRVKDYNTQIKSLKDNFIALALDFYVGVYNNKTQRAIPIDEFLRSEQNSAYRTNILNVLQSKQQISRSVGNIVTNMVRQANQRIADHTQEDLTAFRNFEKDFSFKDLIRIDEYTDPRGIKRKESVLLTRNTINYYLKKAEIFKDAESIVDKSAKSRFIKEELAKVSYDVDARFLFVNEYLQEMKEYYKDNTIDWIDPSSESFYMGKILDFHKEQFSDYGNEYAEYRTNDVIDQTRSKIQYYLDQKEAFIASLQIQNLTDQEKEDRLTDWISYNSPFLLLNERFGFSTTEGANVNKEWKTAPQEVNVKTYTTRAGVTITGRPTIDYTKRKAKDHIVNKARYKYEDGTVTGFYDSKYASMEQEMIERELKAFQFEQSGDTVSADKERKRKIQWDYLKFVENRQKYYMDMLPYHVKKELKWYNLVDVKKDYAEQFSDSLSSIMSFKGDSFLNFLGTELMKLIKLSFGFMWDKVVRTVSEKHIKERKQYYDFVSGQIKLSYDPAGFNNVLNKLGTGDVRTTDVFNYFSYLRDAAIQFQERSQAEELIKIGQFLTQNAKILDRTTSKDLVLTDTDIASLNWHINSKLYGAKREEIYKGTESNLWKPFISDRDYALTQAERDEKKLLTQRIAYLNQVLATATDLKAINQINEQIRLAENQLSNIKREMNKYTGFGAYSSYVVLKRLSFGVAGRALDFSSTLMAGIKQALDGRIYGFNSYFKSLGTITSLYAPNALASLTTAAGVVSLNPALAAAGVGARFGAGVINQTNLDRKKQIAKINQILYRVGALDYLNYKEDDNVTSFVNKSNLTEEALAALKTLSPFSTLSQVEIINKGVPALAVFYETKIKDLNGKEHSLLDAFDVDDNLDLVWKTSEFGTQEAAGFNWYKGFNMQQAISKAYTAQRLTSGDYDVTTSRYGDTKLMVRALMLLRRFMGEFLNSRFGDAVPDEDTGLVFMGSYKALLKTASRIVPSWRTQETKEFQEARVAASRQILFDVAMLGGLSIVAKLMLEAVKGDDDDEEIDYLDIFVFNFNNTVERLVTENFQFVDPNIIKGKASTGTISPILGDLMDFYHVGESILKAYTEGDTMTHREMIGKNLAPKRKVIKRYTEKNKDGEDVEKVIYYPEVVGGELTKGKYSKDYEPRSRLWYNTKKLVPFMNLYIKYEKQQKKLNEMKTKE